MWDVTRTREGEDGDGDRQVQRAWGKDGKRKKNVVGHVNMYLLEQDV